MMDEYQKHPKWKELEGICTQLEKLKIKAQNLRNEIDKDLFGEDKNASQHMETGREKNSNSF